MQQQKVKNKLLFHQTAAYNNQKLHAGHEIQLRYKLIVPDVNDDDA